VTPGNIDGPDSPYYGRGGWSWYTGSASWLQRVITHWVLGVRPIWTGLLIAPCLPTGWQQARMTRTFRGVRYDIEISRSESAGPTPMVTVDGMELTDNVIRPDVTLGGTHRVVVKCR
jgi:cellobiose phosphorylase